MKKIYYFLIFITLNILNGCAGVQEFSQLKSNITNAKKIGIYVGAATDDTFFILPQEQTMLSSSDPQKIKIAYQLLSTFHTEKSKDRLLRLLKAHFTEKGYDFEIVTDEKLLEDHAKYGASLRINNFRLMGYETLGSSANSYYQIIAVGAREISANSQKQGGKLTNVYYPERRGTPYGYGILYHNDLIKMSASDVTKLNTEIDKSINGWLMQYISWSFPKK